MPDRDLARRIPDQSRIEELAAYFDETDTGDLPLEEATDVLIARSELEQISLRLPREDIAELERRAAEAGVGYTTLLRMIVRAHLRRPTPPT